jgi:hypothetical protein
MEKIAQALIIGCVVALAAAIVFRLLNMEPLLANPVVGMMKLSMVLSLLAIAIGVNKKS